MKLTKAASCFLPAAGALLWLGAPTLKAATIYSDTFSSGTNGATLVGLSPETNLTGATYVGRGRGQNPPAMFTTFGSPAGSSSSGANGAAGISLASGGSFTRVADASIFTISADLAVGNIGGSGAVANAGASTRGLELGFYSSPFSQGTNDANEGFTGFSLQNAGSSNGILQFVQNGVSLGETSLAVLVGNLDTSSFYDLTYSVDTSTGNLLSASFNGVDIFSDFSASATGAFTDTATAFAGFGASSNANNTSGYIDNFSVEVIPEPSSAMLGFIGGALLLRRRRLAE